VTLMRMMNARRSCLLGWLVAAGMLGAEDALDQAFPVRGLSLGAPAPAQVERFVGFMGNGLAPLGVNTLILRVDFNYQYESHPELRDRNALSLSDVKAIARAGREHGIRIIPQINLLGHQSWATRTGNLLRVYPEFDETPWVKMPEKHVWPNPDGLYCKSYCPLHPQVHKIVFALVDELCAAFETDAFHAGLDEVFYLGEDRCPRCAGKDKAELFAGEVTRIRDHLAAKHRQLWMWGDRLLDGRVTGLGEWEASLNDTHRAIDLIPKDVVICDWHYDRAEPTAPYFALKGFQVVSCPWKNPASATQQVRDILRFREQSHPILRDRFIGVVQTVWSGADGFLDNFQRFTEDDSRIPDEKSEAACLIRVFEEMSELSRPSRP
jgi:hypothetical protein